MIHYLSGSPHTADIPAQINTFRVGIFFRIEDCEGVTLCLDKYTKYHMSVNSITAHVTLCLDKYTKYHMSVNSIAAHTVAPNAV